MAHVNENLELLDHHLVSQGGLLALLPAEGENGNEDERGIFAQWLRYTQALVGRVAELEREVASLRDLLAGEHMVPSVRRQSTVTRELCFPQDRYVLAGLNDALWVRLNEDLNVAAEMTGARNRRADERLRPRRCSNDKLNEVGSKGDWLGAVSWVEVTSRVFRVEGQESVFVIPAWGIHPGAEAVRKIENQPLVQTVARGSSQHAKRTAKEKSGQRMEIEALKKENDDLKFRLQCEEDELQDWFAIWDVERKERMSAVKLVHEELDAEKKKCVKMQRILEASGLEHLFFFGGELSQGSITTYH